MQHIRDANFLHWLLISTPSAVEGGVRASVIKLIGAFFCILLPDILQL